MKRTHKNTISTLKPLLLTLAALALTAAPGTGAESNISPESDTSQWKTVRMRVTAYCPCEKCCGPYADGFTANGTDTRKISTFVAADSKYPFGTQMIIPGYNNSTAVKVLDRGGAIKQNRLDVFFPTHQQALAWGVQYLEVKIKTN